MLRQYARSALFLLLAFLSSPVGVLANGRWDPDWWCKCTCFSEYTILPILRPERPTKPCLTCTKQWCLDAKLTICTNATLGESDPDTATGKEGDVQALCFQRDRPLDQMVVTLFLLVIFGLLIGAAVKGQMERHGIDAHARRAWWKSVVPRLRGRDELGMAELTARRRERAHGAYQRLDDPDTPR